MNKQTSLKHPVQKHIIDMLTCTKMVRFSELRPPRVDTNLFSYHLKLLVRSGLIAKLDKVYTLSDKGLAYVERVVARPLTQRSQPKVVTLLLIQNGDGQVLLQEYKKQPYMNTWTLPYGEIQIDDLSIQMATKREALDQLGLKDLSIRHVGDCYMRVHGSAGVISTTFAHVFRSEIDVSFDDDTLQWVDPRKLGDYNLSPTIEQIIARSFFGDEHFFAEFEHEWSIATL